MLKIQALALLLISVLAFAEALPNQLHVVVPGTAQPRVCETQDLQRRVGKESEYGAIHGLHPLVGIARGEDDLGVRVCGTEFFDKEAARNIADALLESQ